MLTTKDQFADELTQSNFVRDEWNDLLRLFHIIFSVLSCLKGSKKESLRTRTRGGKIEANDEFVVEGPKSVFNTEFECILKLGRHSAQKVTVQIVPALRNHMSSVASLEENANTGIGKTNCGNDKQTHRYKVVPPQLSDFPISLTH